jgi:hypothetical protein
MTHEVALVVDCSAGEVRIPEHKIDYKMKLMGVLVDPSDMRYDDEDGDDA